MDRRLYRLIRRIALLSAMWAIPLASVSAQEVAWRSDYNRARQEAAEKGRPLVIDIGTESCYWCRQLDLRTFKDPALAAYLNEKTVPLKLDGQRVPGLAEALNVQSYPTLVFAGPDGRILGMQEGFVEAPRLKELAQRTVAAVAAPDWMVRDLEDATNAANLGNSARAVALLKNVVEDGQDRPVQGKARQLLQELERQAASRLTLARGISDKTESLEALMRLARSHAGTPAAREAAQMLAAREGSDTTRARRALDLLSQAREDYRVQQFSCCLDRCETLTTLYGDLPEAAEAVRLLAEIKANPEWMKLACDQLADRLSVLYLGLADSWLKKGQPQQATFYLERVVQSFPNTRHAEAAQVRLTQIQGSPARPSDLKK